MIKKIKNQIIILVAFSLLFFIFSINEVNAAKKFVRKTKPSASTGSRSYSSSSTIPASARYRPDKLGILLSLTHFNNLESVSYSFTYMSNGISQGVGGNITAANNPTEVRELLFGTCSGGVCRYHSNLSNASLTLTAKLTNGQTAIKRYRIRTYR